jgi:hypothetical protein
MDNKMIPKWKFKRVAGSLSLTRLSQNILIGIFILIAFYFSVLGNWFHYEIHNPYTMGDWLINYQGGFIRRGFLGECVYQLSIYLKWNAGLIVFYLQLIFYFLFFVFTYFSILKQKQIYSHWLLIFSPFIFYFQVFDPQGGFRKEIIFFSILAFTVWAANKFSNKRFEVIVYFILLFYPLAILTHEMLAIYLPLILIIYFLKVPLTKKRLQYLIPLLALSILTFLACILNHTSSSNVTSIIKSLDIVGYEIHGGAMDWLDKSAAYSFNELQYQIENSSFFKIYFFCSLMSLLACIPLFQKIRQFLKNKIILILLLVVFVGSMALLVIWLDWGRFLYINFVSLFLISLVIDENINETKYSGNLIFLFVLSVIYFSVWHIPHFGGQPMISNINSTNGEGLIDWQKKHSLEVHEVQKDVVEQSRILENTGALSKEAFKAQLRIIEPITTLKPGQLAAYIVGVKNVSTNSWPATGTNYPVHLGNHWLNSDGEMKQLNQTRVALSEDLEPNNEEIFLIKVTAPSIEGQYILEFDMVQENVAWFKYNNSKSLQIHIEVRK